MTDIRIKLASIVSLSPPLLFLFAIYINIYVYQLHIYNYSTDVHIKFTSSSLHSLPSLNLADLPLTCS